MAPLPDFSFDITMDAKDYLSLLMFLQEHLPQLVTDVHFCDDSTIVINKYELKEIADNLFKAKAFTIAEHLYRYLMNGSMNFWNEYYVYDTTETMYYQKQLCYCLFELLKDDYDINCRELELLMTDIIDNNLLMFGLENPVTVTDMLDLATYFLYADKLKEAMDICNKITKIHFYDLDYSYLVSCLMELSRKLTAKGEVNDANVFYFIALEKRRLYL